jgi:hypothetical protein
VVARCGWHMRATPCLFLGDIDVGRASSGWAVGGGGSWHSRSMLVVGATLRRAAPLGMAVRVWVCLTAREVDLGGGARPGSPGPATSLLAVACAAGSS